LGGVHWTVLLFCFYFLSRGKHFVFLLQPLEMSCLVVSRWKHYQLKTHKGVLSSWVWSTRMKPVDNLSKPSLITSSLDELDDTVCDCHWYCLTRSRRYCVVLSFSARRPVLLFFPSYISCTSQCTPCWCVYGMYPLMSTHSMTTSFYLLSSFFCWA